MFAPAMFTPSIQLNENLPTDSPLYITVNHQRCVYPSAFTRFVSRFPTDHSCETNVLPLLRQMFSMPTPGLWQISGLQFIGCEIARMRLRMNTVSSHVSPLVNFRELSITQRTSCISNKPRINWASNILTSTAHRYG